MPDIGRGLIRNLGVFYGIRNPITGAMYHIPAVVEGGEGEPTETTLAAETDPTISPSIGTAPNDVPYTATITVTTPATWSYVDAAGNRVEYLPPTRTYVWRLDGEIVEGITGHILPAGDATRIGKTITVVEIVLDPVTLIGATAQGNAIGPILDVEEEPDTVVPDPLSDSQWGFLGSFYIDANEQPVTLWNPTGTSAFKPTVFIDTGVAIHSAQWSTDHQNPVRDTKWETLDHLRTAGTRHEFTTEMLNLGTGDWDQFNATRTPPMAVRYRLTATGPWSLQSLSKKTMPVPTPLTPPAAIANWTLSAGTSPGQISIAIVAGQPTSWGQDTPGTIQWLKPGAGWQDVPSLSFTSTLESGYYGQTVEIKLRARGGSGGLSAESAKSVQVPGTPSVATAKWMPLLLIGQEAYQNRANTAVYRYCKGGEHYQFFHSGDIHRLYPTDLVTVMDVGGYWVSMSATDEFPVYWCPEQRGVGSRFGICAKWDPQVRGRFVYAGASRTGANPAQTGGLFTCDRFGNRVTHSKTNFLVVGGQGAWDSIFRAWHRTILWNRNNFNEWIFVNRRYSGSGGETMKSTDGAETWSVANTYIANQNLARIYTIAQAANGTVYMGSENGIHTSTNFGGSWNAPFRPGGQFPTTGWVTGIECHPTNAQIAYIAVYQHGVYRTTDGFATAQRISTANNAHLYQNVFASPYDFNKVWMMTIHVAHSGGAALGFKPRFSPNGLAATPDLYEVTADNRPYGWDANDRSLNATGGTRTLFQAGVIPVNASNNEAAIIHAKAKNYSTRNGYQFRMSMDGAEHAGAGDQNQIGGGIVFSRSNQDVYAVAAFDKGLIQTRNRGAGFYRMGQGKFGVSADIAGCGAASYSPDNPNHMVALGGDYGAYSAGWTKNANAAEDAINWTTINQILNDKNGSNTQCRFIAFPQVAGAGHIVYSDHFKCTNFTASSPSWSSVRGTNFPPGYNAHVCLASFQNPQVIYAVNSDMTALFRSDNGGGLWSQYCSFGSSILLQQGMAKAVSLAIDPLNEDRVAWFRKGASSGVFMYNGSGSPQKISGTQFEGITGFGGGMRIRFSHNWSGLIYFQKQDAGDAMIYRSQTFGADGWEALGTQYPSSGAVRSMDIGPHTDIVYAIGTIGTRYFPPPANKQNAACVAELAAIDARQDFDKAKYFAAA